MKLSDEILSKLLMLKHRGKVKASQLAQECGISESDIRDHVRHLRRQGVPITSDSEGYGYAKNIDEILPTVNHLTSRGISEFVTAGKILKNFYTPNSQAGLFNDIKSMESMEAEIIEAVRKAMRA